MMEVYLRHAWVIDLVLMALVVVVLLKLIGMNPVDATRILFREVKELAHRKWTVGSLNALAMIIVFVIGIVFIIADQTTEVFRWLGLEGATGESASSGLLVVVVLAMLVIIVSLRTALAEGQRNGPRR